MTATLLVSGPCARRPLLSLALAGLLVSLAACHTTEDFLDPEPELLSWSPALPMTLSNELQSLKTKASTAGIETRFKVGKLLQRLFFSSDGRYFLSYVDAKLEQSLRESLWYTHFTLVLALQSEGSYHLIQANGTASSVDGARASGRQAIEICVNDLYKQVSALLPRDVAGR